MLKLVTDVGESRDAVVLIGRNLLPEQKFAFSLF